MTNEENPAKPSSRKPFNLHTTAHQQVHNQVELVKLRAQARCVGGKAVSRVPPSDDCREFLTTLCRNHHRQAREKKSCVNKIMFIVL